MRIIKNKKGLTLIELIVAMAIIAIVATSFLLAFSDGFSNIIFGGNRSRASVQAQEILDRVYAEAEFKNGDGSPNRTLLRQEVSDLIGGVSHEDYSEKIVDFDEDNTSTEIRFYVSNTTESLLIQNDVYVVTLRVYYDNFKRYVTVSSPIPR